MSFSIPITEEPTKPKAIPTAPTTPVRARSMASFLGESFLETTLRFLGYSPGKFPDKMSFVEKAFATAKEIPGAALQVGKEIIKAPLRVGATIVDPWVNFAVGQPLVPDKPIKFPLLGDVPTVHQTYKRFTDAGLSPLEAGLMSGSGLAMDLAISAGMGKFFLRKKPIKVAKGEFVPTVEKGKVKMTLGKPGKTKPIVKDTQYFKLGENGVMEAIPTTSKTVKVNIYDVSKTPFQKYVAQMKAQLAKVGITYTEKPIVTKTLTLPKNATNLAVRSLNRGPIQTELPGLPMPKVAIPSGRITKRVEPSLGVRKKRGLDPVTPGQIKYAHTLANEKLLIVDGKVKPQYRRLAKSITGKTKTTEMTRQEANRFIEALDKLNVRTVHGVKQTPIIPSTKAITPTNFFDRTFKEPTLIKFITPSNRYAKSLGAYDLIEPSIKAKTALELERARVFKALGEIEKRLYKLENVSLVEKIKKGITAATPKEIQKWWDMLDKHRTAEAAGLTGEKAKLFTEMRALTESMLERTNEIRAKVGLEPINSMRAYITHISDIATKKALAEKYPFPEEVKYWLNRVNPKHIYNPTAFNRLLESRPGLLKDPIKSLKAMVSMDLKQVYLEQPNLFFREQMEAYKSIMPASTRQWLEAYVNEVIKGYPTKLDNLTNVTLDKLGARKTLDLLLRPLGRTTGYNIVKQMSSSLSRLIHDALIWGRIKLVIRNHTQKFLGLGMYDTKAFVKASFPAGRELKAFIKDQTFWQSSNRKFLETQVGLSKGLLAKLEKIGYKPYEMSHVSNVTHTMKTAYYAGKELVDKPKYSKLGWTMDDVAKEMEHGAMSAQYWYNLMGMPEVYRSGTLRPIFNLQSWWMNYTTNYWRELLHRLFTGKTGWGKEIPFKWRLAAGRHVLTSIIFIEGFRRVFGLDYRQVALLGVLPSYLSPPGQLVAGLFKYITADSDYQRQQGLNQMKWSWKAFVPGSKAIQEWLDAWNGEISIKELFFYVEKEDKKEKRKKSGGISIPVK